MSYKNSNLDTNVVNISEAVNKFKERRSLMMSGKELTLKTGFEHLNSITANGFYKNTINVIAAHSGVGKTSLTIQLALDIIENNSNVRVLFFTLEMASENIISRIVSNKIKKTVLDVNTNKELEIEEDVLKDIEKLNIDFFEFGGNNNQLFDKIDSYVTKYPNDEILVIIDHSLLVEGASDGEKIAELSLMLNYCKKIYKNTTYLILSQLNDAMLSPDRIFKKTLTYPVYTDLYFGRQLFQISDIVMVLNRPADYIETNSKYGFLNLPLFYSVTKGSASITLPLIYVHVIKGRDSGKNVISCFIDNLRHNRLIEIGLNELLKSNK